MMLTSLEDNFGSVEQYDALDDCGCEKRKKLLERGLADVVVENTVRGAVSGTNVLGDAMRNVFLGLSDAVRACAEPIVRTVAPMSAAPVVLLARPKQGCTTCGNASAKNTKHNDENANANNNQNTINIVVHGYPPNGFAPNGGIPTSPFQNAAPQNGFPQASFQSSPFTGNPLTGNPQTPEAAPQVVREIIREPVIVEKIVEKPTFVEKIKERMQLVKRIPKPKKVYIKRTQNNYVPLVRTATETSYDTESVNRTYTDTAFDKESITRTARVAAFDTESVNRAYTDTNFDTESVNRPTADVETVKKYLRKKAAEAQQQ